ncbi:protein of unknown function [Cardinium endosymbiont cEper1 of Encarsia pergandiella]|nr:protein of unknown function [Cardinium endosymbiont cEper1 of Encarsia pergandiella]
MNVNYLSTKYTIEELIELIHTKISNHFNEYKIISFVIMVVKLLIFLK